MPFHFELLRGRPTQHITFATAVANIEHKAGVLDTETSKCLLDQNVRDHGARQVAMTIGKKQKMGV